MKLLTLPGGSIAVPFDSSVSMVAGSASAGIVQVFTWWLEKGSHPFRWCSGRSTSMSRCSASNVGLSMPS